MAAGYVTKVVGDGNSGTFSCRFWCPDTSASPQLLFAGGVITDGAGNLVDFTAASPVTQSGTWNVGLSTGTNSVGKVAVGPVDGREYETVAASQTDQALGATGATGDDLDGLLIVPATAAAGAVSIKDGAGSAISVFAGGGTTALPTLAPIFVPLGLRSTAGAWKVTTGTNVSVIGIGNFT